VNGLGKALVLHDRSTVSKIGHTLYFSTMADFGVVCEDVTANARDKGLAG